MTIAIVTGGNGGLGSLIVTALQNYYDTVLSWDLATGVDVKSKYSLECANKSIGSPIIDVLVNCAGVNLPCMFSELTEQIYDNTMNVNAKSIWLTAQVLLNQLRNGTILNVVSNASHMPMTASLAYNMSKAAAHMATLQMARELYATHGVTVFGISPNKLANTGMTQSVDARVAAIRGWTPEEAKAKQLAALPTGEETPPEAVAEFIAWLLSAKARHKYLHGTIIPYGGER